ncbi:alpha/beta hydrolase [Metabacillus elymi]|uniref:Alpha/beta fold hydrolase n=1 Tax=Metabacillus elymi TaxID=2745198 RepID=A0ABX6S3R3_9BACI|nr:alpha/beta fold hydrolase [Metabacillus sp. KUDC1714]QNF27878.1 alpha/beta fold hydrolase [Metabacillus sp. KUDC1714]
MNVELHPVIEGAESLFFSGNEIGVLLCHGFNGTPQSMQYIGEQLTKYGYTVSIPRLNGHGTHYLDMETSTYEDWISGLQTAYNHLKKQCEKVYIVGQSMGGALTLQVAANNQNVDGIFLINAAVTDVCYKEFCNKVKPAYVQEGSPDINKSFVFEITYEKVPLKAIHQLLHLMDDTKKKVSSVSSPTVIFKSATDHVVPPTNSEFIFDQVNTAEKKMIVLQNSYHVASMDHDAPLIVEQIHQHIKKLITDKTVKNTNKKWITV